MWSTLDLLTVSLSIPILYVSSIIITQVYNAYYGPLSKFPGPKMNALSILPWSRTTWKGDDHVDMTAFHSEYGEVVRFGPNDLSFTGNSQIWKDVYGFRKQGQLEAIKDPIFYGKPPDKSDGLFTADYQNHARQRRVVSHAFSDKALKEQEPLLKAWAKKLKTKLAEQAQRDQKTDIVEMFTYTTFDIMSDLAFAEPLYMLDGSEYASWAKSFSAGVKHGTRLRAFRIISRFINWALDEISLRRPGVRRKEMEHFKNTTDRVDRRLAKTPDRPDLWTVILQRGGLPTATSKNSHSEMTLQEHYMLAALFMTAGTETTATALSGTFFHLLQNPHHMKNVQQEIRTTFRSIDDVQLETLVRLPVLEATLKEGLRMYPPVAIALPRISPPGGMMVGRHFVPEGTSFGIHQYATYRLEENFKYANEFRPERWLGDPKFRHDRPDVFEPFSVGPRNCLGKNLALIEMRLILATILLHFDARICQESEKWANHKLYTLWMKPALMCKLNVVKG